MMSWNRLRAALILGQSSESTTSCRMWWTINLSSMSFRERAVRSLQHPVPHRESFIVFQHWLGVSSLSMASAVKRSAGLLKTSGLKPQQITSQLTTRKNTSLNYASPAGQPMDSVTGLGFLKWIVWWSEHSRITKVRTAAVQLSP